MESSYATILELHCQPKLFKHIFLLSLLTQTKIDTSAQSSSYQSLPCLQLLSVVWSIEIDLKVLVSFVT